MTERSWKNRLWYRFMQRSVQFVAVFGYRARFSGIHNIPSEGGVLVVSNHQSHLDPPLIGIGCPRRMNYLARETLFHFGPFGWLLHSLDAIPIDRDGFGLSGIKESLRRLKRGEILVVFPEGTRSRDGEIAPFRPGFTMLATRSKAAILPAAVEGPFSIWPRSKKFPGLGCVHVHYGKPLMPEDYAGMDEPTLMAEIERRVRECRDILRQHPDFCKEKK
jgi:1-acyl-sn-glycerol-3-phosphate acyltransferase